MSTSLHAKIAPTDVRITRHAVEQLLLRYPEDLLPRYPEDYIRHLLMRAEPAPDRITRRYQNHPKGPAEVLTIDRWVLILVPARQTPPPWALVTITRVSSVETNVPRALREDRLRNYAAFHSGEAAALLHCLIADAGTTDPRTLGRLWYEHRYPLVLHGGYDGFEEFYRAVLRLPRPERPWPEASWLAYRRRGQQVRYTQVHAGGIL